MGIPSLIGFTEGATRAAGAFLEGLPRERAPILAIGIVPLRGAVGTAVDYSRANAARVAFQIAVDSTAFAMSKNAGSIPLFFAPPAHHSPNKKPSQ